MRKFCNKKDEWDEVGGHSDNVYLEVFLTDYGMGEPEFLFDGSFANGDIKWFDNDGKGNHKYSGETFMESRKLMEERNGYASESIDGEYDDEDVGDGQWHVFDYGHGFPYVEQYMIMAPTGDTWPATSSGAICDYDGEYSYSTRMEMED